METQRCLFDELETLGVLNVRDGSAEVFFDDVGVVQKVVFRKRKRPREGEPFTIQHSKGQAVADFDANGELRAVVYETTWRRLR